MLNGELNEAGQIADAELLHQMAPVGLYCLGGQEEKLCDTGVRVALDQELKYFPFTRAEARQRLVHLLRLMLSHIVSDNHFGNLVAEKGLAVVNCANSLNYIDTRGFLQDVATASGL